MKLLDSMFLADYVVGHESVGSYLSRHEFHEFATTTLNLEELAVAIRLEDGTLDEQSLLADLDWVTIIPVQKDHALTAAELEAPLQRDPEVDTAALDSVMVDLLIAAVARETDATVVTENVDDFARFEGVTAETYR